VRDGAFDIVLMDLHMPVMNGLDATKAIRLLPPPAGRIPILAATAGATEAELRSCLDAGMDDAVAKPIQPAALFKAIDRALFGDEDWDDHGHGDGHGDEATTTNVSIEERLNAGAGPFNAAILDDLVAQMGSEIALDLIASFGTLSAEALVTLDKGAVASLHDIAHRLKSGAGTLGLRSV
jgi:FixJ family two-component response regulator